MAIYKKFTTKNNEPIQVDSAVQDGLGRNIANTYLNKVTSVQPNNKARLYIINADGSQGTTILDETSTSAWTIPLRTSNGNIILPSPTANNHATNKEYVDSGLSLKVNISDLNNYVNWSSVSQNAGASTIVQRKSDASVDIRVPLTPTYDNEPSSKQYVDNHHDSTKADKSELTNYVLWSSVSQSAGGLTVVQRKEDASVDIRVPLTPTYNNEPTSKQYVDNGLAGKADSSSLNNYVLWSAVSYDAYGDTIVRRKANSKVDIRVPEPTYGDEPASKNYADTKLTKVTSSASHNRLYLINADGSQSTTELSSSSTSGYSVPYRRQDGNIMVPLTPGQNSDAASKKYVDAITSGTTSFSKIKIGNTELNETQLQNLLDLLNTL